MVAMAPARQIERTTNEATSKVVPVADLVLETFRNGRMIRQEHLDTIYRTVTSNRPTRHLTEITTRTVAGNAADLAAGRTVDAKTLHGRKVAEITAAPATAIAPAATATKAPAARATNATLADLIAPPLNRASTTLFTAPFAAPVFAAATKAAANALLTPEPAKENKEKEDKTREKLRSERDETAKAVITRDDLDRTRNEIAGKLNAAKAIKPETNKGAALAIEAAITESKGATPEAARIALENARSIEARIDTASEKREEAPTPLQAKRAEQVATIAQTITLAERYETEGAEGHFKGLILEAITAPTPAAEARDTMKMLEATPFGQKLIAQVEQDRAELAATASRREELKAAPERATPFAGILEGFDLAALAFPAGLRKHAPEAQAALAA